MDTGQLTAKTNDAIASRRYTGSFGQPYGYGSILEAGIRRDGRLVLTIRKEDDTTWTADLSNEQRKDLATWAQQYDPVLWEDIEKKL